MAGDDRCPRCGVLRSGDELGGLCPQCLLAAALDDPAPKQIGDYEIVGELGRGGMGVVYRVKHKTIEGRVVALKVIRAGGPATPEERRRFRAEIEAVAGLKHPLIVPVYEIGEHTGEPYYTMPVYAGSLADSLARFRTPERAAALLAKVARAVHHGHERGVLHRDLKPANILLDDRDEPHVSDFGTAKRTDQQESTTGPSKLIGTPMYMAPEQLNGGGQGRTASDVYSLGVVLYQLLTGRPPFDGDLPTILRKVVETDPIRPRTLEHTVPRDLETICLRCLEKDPSARYRSAAELADDLERFLRDEPITARPPTRRERAGRLIRRHWLSVGSGVALLLLLAVVAVTAISVARAQEQDLLDDALRTNAYAAHAYAESFAFRLREQLDVVQTMADDPRVVQVLRDHDPNVLKQRHAGSSFDSINVFDRSGRLIAHVPTVAPGTLGLGYEWRDYFDGARRLAESGLHTGYIARAIRSETDLNWQFAISAPLYDASGAWVGVLMVTVGTDSEWGRNRLDRVSQTGPMAVVVAPRDRARNSTEGEGEHVVVLHNGLRHGAGIAIDSPRLRELRLTRTNRDQLQWADSEPLTDAAYSDPVPGFEGRWLAGFAPVRKTGFIVIVQTRHDAAVALNAHLTRRLALSASIAVLGWIAVFAGLLFYALRRDRRRSGTPQQRSTVLTGE